MFNLFLRYVKFENLPKNDYKNLHLRQWNDLTLGINGTGRVIEEAVFFLGGGFFGAIIDSVKFRNAGIGWFLKIFTKSTKIPNLLKFFNPNYLF